MALLPKAYEEAARESIATYDHQIEKINAIIESDEDGAHVAIVEISDAGNVGRRFGLDEDLIIEALIMLAGAKAESINVLRAALTEEAN